jgi:hypothetical protein
MQYTIAYFSVSMKERAGARIQYPVPSTQEPVEKSRTEGRCERQFKIQNSKENFVIRDSKYEILPITGHRLLFFSWLLGTGSWVPCIWSCS